MFFFGRPEEARTYKAAALGSKACVRARAAASLKERNACVERKRERERGREREREKKRVKDEEGETRRCGVALIGEYVAL